MNCEACLPGRDPDTECVGCILTLRDPASNCLDCLSGLDPSTNCSTQLPAGAVDHIIVYILSNIAYPRSVHSPGWWYSWGIHWCWCFDATSYFCAHQRYTIIKNCHWKEER